MKILASLLMNAFFNYILDCWPLNLELTSAGGTLTAREQYKYLLKVPEI